MHKPRARAAEAAVADRKQGELVTTNGATPAAPVSTPPRRGGLLDRMAAKYHMEPAIFERTMYAMAMPKEGGTREELISCLMVAHEHDLNPLTKEIYFMKTKDGRIQPILSVDGWITKAQRHPQFRGFTFKTIRDSNGDVVACEGTLHRADWTEPLVISEEMAECKGGGTAWGKTPVRMLRHRTCTQLVRYGFGLSGVMDRDEFDQWQAGMGHNGGPPMQRLNPTSDDSPPANVIEGETVDGETVDADDAFNGEAFVAEITDRLQKVATQDDLLETWDEIEKVVEGKLDLKLRPTIYAAYDAAEKRLAKGKKK